MTCSLYIVGHNMIDLSKQKKRVYSQFNQDGVLECIFDKIGTTNKYFVEFGSEGTDAGGGNTPFLRHKFGFDGLLMDGTLHKEKRKYKLHTEFITAENINEVLSKHSVPAEFDFLSIDVDGEDYYIMEALDLNNFSPRVVCIETNPIIQPPYTLVQPHNPDNVWNGGHRYGCGIKLITDLMNLKNYSLVAYCGVDAIFVRNDCQPQNHFEYVNDVKYLYDTGVLKIGFLMNTNENPKPKKPRTWLWKNTEN